MRISSNVASFANYFAQSIQQPNGMAWQIPYGYVPFVSLNDEQKDQARKIIPDQCLQIKNEIRNLIPNNNTLLDSIISIPIELGANQTFEPSLVYILLADNRVVNFCLAGWGMRRPGEKPIPFDLTSGATWVAVDFDLQLQYQEEEPYVGQLHLNASKYQRPYPEEIDQSLAGNNLGMHPLKSIKTDSQLRIRIKDFDQSFGINEDSRGKTFNITLPYFKEVPITVVNDENQPIPNKEIQCDYGSNSQSLITDSNGRTGIPDFPANNHLQISHQSEKGNTFKKSYTISKGNSKVVHKISKKNSALFKYFDLEKKPIVDHPISISRDGKTENLRTNIKGEFSIEELRTDQNISFKSSNPFKINKNLIIKDPNGIYNLYMTKDRRWLWILLGLLALLLLFFLLNFTIIQAKDSSTNEALQINTMQVKYTPDRKDSIIQKLDFHQSSWKLFRKSRAKYNSEISVSVMGLSCFNSDPQSFDNGILNFYQVVMVNPQSFIVEIRDTLDPSIKLERNTFSLDNGQKYDDVNLSLAGLECYSKHDVSIENPGYHTKLIENLNIEELLEFNGAKYIGLYAKPLPCDASPETGGVVPRTVVHENCNCKELRIAGNFANIPDQIDVYCGTSSSLLVSTGMQSDSFNVLIPRNSCTSRDISVKITPSSDENTRWRYKLICNE